MSDADALYSLGIALIFAGIMVILVAVILLFLAGVKEGGKVKGGGVLIIGHFPIIFGTDKEAVKAVLLLSLALTILLIMMAVVFFFVLR